MVQNVLAVFPHPDDETLAVGGTLAYYAEAGHPVTYACFTLGQMGRGMGNPFFANRETLPIIREKELRAACQELGISDLRLMGFRDKTLEFEDPAFLSQVVYNLIVELEPWLVVTYYPGYSVHPDHEALAFATVRAIRQLPEEKRPALHCQAFARGYEEALGPQDVTLDTSGVWEKKFKAMKAHLSQTATWISQMEQALNGLDEERQRVIQQLSREALYTYKV